MKINYQDTVRRERKGAMKIIELSGFCQEEREREMMMIGNILDVEKYK
jgi:hypothetical protein